MSISPLERMLILVGGLTFAYKYLTGRWPVGLEIEEVEERA